jgi:hypothetical protein
LIRIELSFLENLRSNWVVIIGLELLSLACPGLGSGSGYVHQLCLCHLVIIMVILILLVWRIGYGVTGLELVSVMTRFKAAIRCDAGNLWLVIIPKSKDQFMERPPMKIVQS